MQLVMPGMRMPHPEDIALIQPGEGHPLESVHNFLFLFFAHLVVWMP